MEKLLIAILTIFNILLLIKRFSLLTKTIALYFYIADNYLVEPTVEDLRKYQDKVIKTLIRKVFKA